MLEAYNNSVHIILALIQFKLNLSLIYKKKSTISLIRIRLKFCRTNKTKVVRIVIRFHTAKSKSNEDCRYERRTIYSIQR